MGNRDKLLDGAKQCLRERGYARTTARDVVATSGANLGSIGYHFGSTEGLLTEAMIEGIQEFGDSFEGVIAAGPPPDMQTTWARIIETFEHHRPLLVASFEAFVQSEHLPEVRRRLAAAYEEAREGLTALFLGPESAADAELRRTVGSVCMAMITGLIAQWVTDPDRAPRGPDIVAGIRTLADHSRLGVS